MVRYGFNKIKLAFDAQYHIVILTLLTYSWHTYLTYYHGIGLQNAGLEPTRGDPQV